MSGLVDGLHRPVRCNHQAFRCGHAIDGGLHGPAAALASPAAPGLLDLDRGAELLPGRQAIDLKRHYSIQQVEYCRNLIFRRNFPIHKLFERSCDIGLLRMLDKITEIFGFRVNKKLRGKLQSVLEMLEHGHRQEPGGRGG